MNQMTVAMTHELSTFTNCRTGVHVCQTFCPCGYDRHSGIFIL